MLTGRLAIAAASLAAVGVVALLSIVPMTLWSRSSADEAAAIADLQEMRSAQEAYAAESGGFYGSPQCLREPAACLDGYAGPAFSSLPARDVRSGYEFVFDGTPDVNDHGYQRWAYQALPVGEGAGRRRAFCTDDTARMCVWDGTAPRVSNGRCDLGCVQLESAP